MKPSYEELQTQVQALTAQRDGLIDELNKTQDEALDARAQCDALAAQVEVVRHAWESVKATDYDRILDEALELTPAACLAQVRANTADELAAAVGEGFSLPATLNEGTQKAEIYKAGWRSAYIFGKQLAERIRQGSAE